MLRVSTFKISFLGYSHKIYIGKIMLIVQFSVVFAGDVFLHRTLIITQCIDLYQNIYLLSKHCVWTRWNCARQGLVVKSEGKNSLVPIRRRMEDDFIFDIKIRAWVCNYD